jgi:hypothetical protein
MLADCAVYSNGICNVRLGERHVDGGRVKYGARRDEDDLDQKGDEAKRVVVEQDARGVSCNLNETPDNHKGHEAPASPANAEEHVDGNGEGKESQEDGVGGQRRPVSVDARFDGTCRQGAVGVGAEADSVARKAGGRHGWKCLGDDY